MLTIFISVKVKGKLLSLVQLFATPWTVAYQASPSMGFSRQEYWSAVPLPSPGDLPNPGIKPGSPALEADALTSEPPGGDASSIPGLGRSPGEGNGNSLQYSCPGKSHRQRSLAGYSLWGWESVGYDSASKQPTTASVQSHLLHILDSTCYC